MKKILFSILCAFMVSTMASAQTYVNVELKDGTIRSYSAESTSKVSFGEKKGTEQTPSGYYSKDEVDAMLRRIDEELQVNHYTLENHQKKLEMIEKTLDDHKMKLEEIFSKHEKKLAEYEKKLAENEKKLVENEKKLAELERRLEALEAK